MSRLVIKEIAERIVSARGSFPLRIGIDGVDAAGKTNLANEIATYLTTNGYSVLRASIDGFHNPRHIRYQRGKYSPEGYYYDSFNYELLIQNLLQPLSPEGNRICRLATFDFKADRGILSDPVIASDDHILIFEGVFLFRPELLCYWDFKIFVDIDFQTSLNRALERDLYLFGEREEIVKKYQERYIPGQEIYLGLEKPKTKANIVIDNNDFTHPVITTHRM